VIERILAVAQKETRHLLRDKRTLFAVLAMPILQLLLFSYALSFDVKNVPTLLIDQDRTVQSRAFTTALRNTTFFKIVASSDTPTAALAAFQKGQVRAAITIAPGFGRAIAGGGTGDVGVLLDGSEPNAATVGRGYAEALSRIWNGQLKVASAELHGVAPARFGGLTGATRIWYNPEAKSSNYLIPGLIVVVIMIVTVQQTSTTLVREADAGTLEQLMVSPLTRGELVIGKVIPWAVIAALDTVAIVATAVFLMGIPLRGSLVLLAVASGLFILCALAIGLVISARAPSVETANQIGIIISFLPAFMLSGFAFPLAAVPPFLQFVSFLFPGRYMVVVSRTVFLKGGGWDVLWPQVAALAAYGVIAMTFAAISMRKRMP
jgi:ABC-2 type transport system permease protein